MVAGYIAGMIIASGMAIAGYANSVPHQIQTFGQPETGKTQLLWTLTKKAHKTPAPPKTIEPSKKQRVGLYVTSEDGKRTFKNISFVDYPGEIVKNGKTYEVLIKEQPQGILYLVDHRTDVDHLAAYESLVAALCSQSYRNQVKPRHRVRVFYLIVTHQDIWYPGNLNDTAGTKAFMDLARPFEPGLDRISKIGFYDKGDGSKKEADWHIINKAKAVDATNRDSVVPALTEFITDLYDSKNILADWWKVVKTDVHIRQEA